MLHEPFCIRTVKRCGVCQEMINIDDEEDHINDNHKEIKCKFCARKIPEILIKLHLGNCEERPTECIYCSLHLIQKEKKEHEYTCGAKTEYCQNCRKYISIRDFEIHLVQSCYPEETYLHHHIDIHNIPVVKSKKSRVSIKDGGKIDSFNVNKISRERVDVHKELGDKIEELKNRDKPHDNKIIEEKNYKISSINSNIQGTTKVEIKENYSSSNSRKKIVKALNLTEKHDTSRELISEIRISHNNKNEMSNYDNIEKNLLNNLTEKEKISNKILKEDKNKIIPKNLMDPKNNEKIIPSSNTISINKNYKKINEPNVTNKSENIVSNSIVNIKKEQNKLSTNLINSEKVKEIPSKTQASKTILGDNKKSLKQDKPIVKAILNTKLNILDKNKEIKTNFNKINEDIPIVKLPKIEIKSQNNENSKSINSSKAPLKNKHLDTNIKTKQENKINGFDDKENINLPKKEITKLIKTKNLKKNDSYSQEKITSNNIEDYSLYDDIVDDKLDMHYLKHNIKENKTYSIEDDVLKKVMELSKIHK